jgi:hypothetical protein
VQPREHAPERSPVALWLQVEMFERDEALALLENARSPHVRRERTQAVGFGIDRNAALQEPLDR